MFDLDIFLAGLAVALLATTLTWIVSLFKRDVSIVDSVWSLVLLALCTTYFLLYGDSSTTRGTIVLALVAVWALRLSGYITWRNRASRKTPATRQSVKNILLTSL